MEQLGQMKEKIGAMAVVPVVVLKSEEEALPLAKALIDGGLPCAEVTFRTDAAEGSIRQISQTYPHMLVGAGTVLTVEQVKRAVAAGARFIVCPGFDAEVVDYCMENEIPVFPGCVTPSEIMQAVKRGLDVIKFFPAEQYGGLGTMKALAGPFPAVKFMPTGGVNLKNLEEYLQSDKILACGGTWMVKRELIEAGDFAKITQLTREAVRLVKEIRK
ncbi:MAG: bifunctional 4-hydroxy-2-oxoglutarate aldolase/2-dehydro-3-deoxy-phosphogluconate aldolase [Firmicutes bacterium]|nr:bifunctional 4-hydroxy-2-oxoglutarate aldolase/2-dehydro-3-deoxy-phosphogluconate aldolase [Bacillota bacterium]